MLSESDKDMIVYYWEEKKDLERWSSWEIKLDMIKDEYPEIVKTWEDIKMSKKIMDALICKLKFEI